jgi:RNA recognition motif-containing protein
MVVGEEHFPLSVAQAFVQFADVESAKKAKDAIHGRLFAGETLQVHFVTPQYIQALPK